MSHDPIPSIRIKGIAWGVSGRLLMAFCLCFYLSAIPLRAEEKHTVKVARPNQRKEVESHGGALLMDYESFQLYSVTNSSGVFSRLMGVEMQDHFFLIHLNAAELDTRKSDQTLARMKAEKPFSGKHLHLVQFVGPTKPEWLEQIVKAGARVISYVPENSYLLYTDNASLQKIRAQQTTTPYLQWEGKFEDSYKIHPKSVTLDPQGLIQSGRNDQFEIQLIKDDTANSGTLALIKSMALEPIRSQSQFRNFINLIVRVNPVQIPLISHQPDVVSILPSFRPIRFGEREDQIVAGNLNNGSLAGPGYLNWLTNHGFSQSNFDNSGIIVDLTDSGVDNGTTTPWHFGLYNQGTWGGTSRVVYNRLVGTPGSSSTLSGCDGHGSLDAHIIAGYDNGNGFPFADADGYHYGLGVCPFARIGSSVIFDTNFTYPDYTTLISSAYNSGARISCNSWGDGGMAGLYNFSAQLYDSLVRDAEPTNSDYFSPGNQQISILFAAGNYGPGTNSLASPATAKNVITVGAADGVQPFGAPDRSGIGDADSTNANSIASFSSRGPCADGRTKPDIMAPGTHISGGVSQSNNDPINYPFGTADTCFNAGAISGGTNGSSFWPDGQQFYTASSGTSQSTPCVAGGCALVMQYFLNTWGYSPSPAMLKAYLLNSARYLGNQGSLDTLPSNQQGMGEMDLSRAFDSTHRILRDQLAKDLFTNSGQIRALTGVVNNTNQPVRITLAWTDAPGSTIGASYNNNLDLIVYAGTNIFKGNVFSNQYSVPGGAFDYKNNVESVFLPAGTSGNIVITVLAANINSEGVPSAAGTPNQDFALVVYNADPTPLPLAASAGATLVAESCMPTNGVIDPGETVTVNFGIQNIGTLPYSNLVVTLLTNSQLQSTNARQTMGYLDSASSVLQVPFTFKAHGPCGSNFMVTLELREGTNYVGILTYPFSLGQLLNAPIFSEAFDSAVPPALADGWSTSTTGGQYPWISTSLFSASQPNSVFVGAPPASGISSIESPLIQINTTNAQLFFANNFDLESEPAESSNPTVGRDGGVLDISIDNNSWTDILTAGGVFISGGYTAPIKIGNQNPFQGRFAWTGYSGGFNNTLIQLPAAAAGHQIKLRWSCGTDTGNTNGSAGWAIDSVVVTDDYYDCCNPLMPPVIDSAFISNGQFYFSFQSIQDQGYSIQTSTNLGLSNWVNIRSIVGDGTLMTQTNPFDGGPRFYRLVSP